MTNTASIALFALIGLLALTIWRIHSGRTGQGGKFRTAWAAGLLALLIAVATDLNSDLGAAIAFAVLVGILGRALGAPRGGQGPVSSALAPPPSSGGGGPSGGGSGGGPFGPQIPIPQLPYTPPSSSTTPGGVTAI